MSSNSLTATPGPEMIGAYLANRLTEEEARAFERYCLEHPDFARDVEDDLKLKIGLHHLDETRGSERKRRRWLMSAAASVAAAALGLALLWQLRSHPQPIAFAALAQMPAVLREAPLAHARLLRVRGASSDEIAIAPEAQALQLRILPDRPNSPNVIGIAPEYSVRLALAAAPTANLVSLGGLRPDTTGYLTVYLRADAVRGRTWLISVKMEDSPSSGAIRQTFTVVFATAGTFTG